MLRKSHIYSSSGTWKSGRLNMRFEAILFPDTPEKKQYVHVNLKGKCAEDFDAWTFANNCLNWVADEHEVFGFTRQHKMDKLTINIIEGKR